MAQGASTLTVAWDTDIDTPRSRTSSSRSAATSSSANLYDPLSLEGAAGRRRAGPLSLPAARVRGQRRRVLVVRARRRHARPEDPAGHDVSRAAGRSTANARQILARPRRCSRRATCGFVIPTPAAGRPSRSRSWCATTSTIAINMKGRAAADGADLMLALRTTRCSIPSEVKAHATEDDPWAADWVKRNAAGVGPYTLVKNEPGVEVVLEATQGHWRPASRTSSASCSSSCPTRPTACCCSKRKAVDMVVGRPGLSPQAASRAFENEPGLQDLQRPRHHLPLARMNGRPSRRSTTSRCARPINYAIPIQAIMPNVLYGLRRADEERRCRRSRPATTARSRPTSSISTRPRR